MDEFDVFTSQPSTTQENGLFEFENIDPITNNHQDDSSSSFIENVRKMNFHNISQGLNLESYDIISIR